MVSPFTHWVENSQCIEKVFDQMMFLVKKTLSPFAWPYTKLFLIISDAAVWWPPPADIFLGHKSRQAGKEPSSPCPNVSQELQASLKPNPCRAGAPSGVTLGQDLCCAGAVPPVEFGNYALWDVTTPAEHRKTLLSRVSVPSFQSTLLCQLVPPQPPQAVPWVWWCCSPVTPEQICNSCSWGQEANTLVMVHCRLRKNSSHGLGTNEVVWEGLVPLKGLRLTSKASGVNHVPVSWRIIVQSERGTLEV